MTTRVALALIGFVFATQAGADDRTRAEYELNGARARARAAEAELQALRDPLYALPVSDLAQRVRDLTPKNLSASQWNDTQVSMSGPMEAVKARLIERIHTLEAQQDQQQATIPAAQETLNACRLHSAWLKANRDVVIPKAYFADARSFMDHAAQVAAAARAAAPDLARQIDDAAYELRLLVASLDK